MKEALRLGTGAARGAMAVGVGVLLWASIAAGKDPPQPSTAHLAHFRHATHARLAALPAVLGVGPIAGPEKLPCGQCHAQAPVTALPVPPGGRGHQPCADARCHGPRLDHELPAGSNLCLACHERGDKFDPGPTRVVHRSDAEREFGWRINHRRHLSVPGLSDCDTCHKIDKRVADGEVLIDVHRPDHRDCVRCHGREGSRPLMKDCQGCHSFGEVPRPPPPRGGVWRVYDKFTHATHRLDVRTAKARPGASGRGWSRYDKRTAEPLGCGACHTTAGRADAIRDMDLLGPCAMGKTCMGQCHNGRWAFQGSGTNLRDCLLCHSNVDERTPAPASHCGG